MTDRKLFCPYVLRAGATLERGDSFGFVQEFEDFDEVGLVFAA
jgi:hypothetical protein